MTTLDDLARGHGTDKSSDGHDFANLYQRLLPPRDAVEVLLEIGVHKGASLKMWADWYHQAQIFGVDNNIQFTPEPGTRMNVIRGDQRHPTDMLKSLSEALPGPPNIIIDDGSHRGVDQMVSFTSLWPILRNGGIYVIEDLHTNYGADHTMGFCFRTTEYLKHLVDVINWSGKWSGKAEGDTRLAKVNAELQFNGEKSQITELTELEKTLDIMIFAKSVAILIKRF